MKKSPLAQRAICGATFTLFALVLSASPAVAQSSAPPPSGGPTNPGGGGAGLGVGAAAFVSGLSGLDVMYDLPRFHLEGVLGFSSQDAGGDRTRTAFQFGARGWYHLHQGTNSDFLLGGGIGIRNASGGGNPSTTTTLIEPGMQSRVFFTPNFSLNFTAGLSFAFGDSAGDDLRTGFVLGAQLLGGIGFTYFFR